MRSTRNTSRSQSQRPGLEAQAQDTLDEMVQTFGPDETLRMAEAASRSAYIPPYRHGCPEIPGDENSPEQQHRVQLPARPGSGEIQRLHLMGAGVRQLPDPAHLAEQRG